MFPIVGKLHSAIQADNIRLNLAGAEFDRLLPRKRGLSMLTAKNKVEERPYHPNPQDKFTISIVHQEESLCVVASLCYRLRTFLTLLRPRTGQHRHPRGDFGKPRMNCWQ